MNQSKNDLIPKIPRAEFLQKLQPAAGLIFFAFIYWLAVRSGLLLVAKPEGIASIWPASGLALAALLIRPKREWRKLLAVIFVVNTLGNWGGGNSLPVSLGFALANILEPFLAAWVLIYFFKSGISFGRAVEIFGLIGVAVLCNGLTALLGAAVPVLAFGSSFFKTWLIWWIADGLGMILIAPLIITWASRPARKKPVSPVRVAEIILLFSLFTIYAWLLFGPFTVAEGPLLRNYLLFPFLIWLGFRFPLRNMTGALTLLAVIAIWNTMRGFGIFGFADQSPTLRLVSVQILLAVVGLTGLLISTIISSRRRLDLLMQSSLDLSQFSASHTLDEVLQRSLDEAESLTHSQIGFIHFLEPDQKTLHLQMWSSNTLRNMCTAGGKGNHYPVDQAGVWVDCISAGGPIMHNDFPNLPHRKGLPAGHAPILRELVVPIIRNDLIVMLMGMGNKDCDYYIQDVEILTQLANLTWDIARRKQAEDALRNSQSLLAESEKIGRVGGWEFNIETQVQTWTAEVYRLHEVDLDYKPTVENGVDFYTPPSRPVIQQALGRAIEHGESFDLELEILTAKNNLRWVHAIGKADLEHRRVFGFFQDITDRKQHEELIRNYAGHLEQRVEERTIELVRANRIKDEFLAMMGHELRTPLNSILGFSQLLLENVRGPLSAKQEDAVQWIQSSGRHLLGLINDILDMTRIESGQLELHPESMYVENSCQSSLGVIKPMALKKSITVNYSCPVFTRIQADPRLLKQILINLLNNAVKFTPRNGSVGLIVETDGQAGLMHFSVTDSGIGISPEDLPKLFQTFVQLDSKLSRQYEGTGLGLVLVKKMVEMHGGSIAVKSEVGTGSVFTFSLPWDPNLEGSAQLWETGLTGEGIATSLPADILYGRKLLIADDDEASVLLIGDYLRDFGYQVSVAVDGREVMTRVEQVLPELILMDIQLPYANGIDLTRQLRDDPRFASIPIIALTAFAMRGDRQRFLDSGMDEYLSKPVNLRELKKLIESKLH